MDELFDWLSSNTETIKETLNEVLDLDFLDVIEGIEFDGQGRDSMKEILCRRSKGIRMEVQGYSLNLLDQLLNHVPWYQKGIVKEPYSKEMRDYIFERDGFECRLCYSSWNGFHCHHIHPHGYANEDNLITLCLKCHDVIHRLLRNKGYPFHRPTEYWQKRSL